MKTSNTAVTASFDLKQSIDARGYKQPDEATFEEMRTAFEDWFEYAFDEYWEDLASRGGFRFDKS